MDDGFPPALYAVYSNPLPGRESALHAWYEDVHIPDSFDQALFESVRRYRALGPSPAQLLTLWGCRYRDEEDALSAVRPVAEALRARGRVEVVQEVVFQQFVFLEDVIRERVGREDQLLTTLHSCWARPDAVPAFERWMKDAEPARLLEVGAVARYGVGAPPAKALVLLEGGEPPLHRSAEMMQRAEPGLPPFGPPTPIFTSGSPAPGPAIEPPPDDAQLAGWYPAWAARWQLISARRA